MKILPLQLLYMLITVLLFTSCSKQENYSCDEKINSWVKENKTAIANFTRSQILEKDHEYQKGIYAAASASKKYDLWLVKLNEVQRLPWSEQELHHINLLKSYLSPALFESAAKVKEMAPLLKQWKETALTTLKWDMRTVASIASDLRTPISKNGDFEPINTSRLATSNNAVIADSESGGGCKCNKTDDYCNGPIAGPNGPLRCSSSNCNTSGSGCGTLWLSSCNGMCF
ncbi:bacteriocin fulvocin C-related protein [Chitinophaga sp. HK235]|uniref:bacteriocin fulvocin C-related protein n=1 Tax=Chitinophaga sp. HK235 TaxID=2952571 RepID=UPI001BA6194D|nr:bacteriocin fulvocin C-related protein [Chitinophaga sp. HK235]